MNALLIVGAVAIVGLVTALVTWWRRDEGVDLGVVSHQWIAEHRLGQGPDPRR